MCIRDRTIGDSLDLQEFSISLWLRVVTGSTGIRLLYGRIKEDMSGGFYMFLVLNNELEGSIYFNIINDGVLDQKAINIVMDQLWHHIVITFNNNYELKFYGDGYYIDTLSFSNAPSYTGSYTTYTMIGNDLDLIHSLYGYVDAVSYTHLTLPTINSV